MLARVEYLGHAGLSITSHLYSRVLPDIQEAAADRFDEHRPTAARAWDADDVDATTSSPRTTPIRPSRSASASRPGGPRPPARLVTEVNQNPDQIGNYWQSLGN
jgi:hypothetical protein